MKFTFFCNYLNHHHVILTDELYKLLGDNFCFVSTKLISPEFLKGSIDYSVDRPYCIRAFDNEDLHIRAIKLAEDSDACLFGADSMEYALVRAKTGKFAIEGSERWLKRGWMNILSPRLLKWQWHYHTKFHKLPWVKIGSSAFTAIDDYRLYSYRGREYKWGYFTQVDEDFDVEASMLDASTSEITPLMWCSRFLTLKHPELSIHMAKKLKEKGYRFMLSMYGDEGSAAKHDGVYPRKKLEALIEELGVGDCVRLMGNRPNGEILEAMRKSSIFLFTSDRYEGWGAVANESMANGCCLVGSDEIGSIPFLIDDGVNGCVFKSKDVNSLYQKVKFLLDNPDIRKRMALQGYEDMKNIWSPQNAAKNLVTLIDDLLHGREVSVKEGPCSKVHLKI